MRRGQLTRADIEVLRHIKAGYRPHSEHRTWNRLAQVGLAYVDVSTSGEGEVELRLWRLTRAGEVCAELDI